MAVMATPWPAEAFGFRGRGNGREVEGAAALCRPRGKMTGRWGNGWLREEELVSVLGEDGSQIGLLLFWWRFRWLKKKSTTVGGAVPFGSGGAEEEETAVGGGCL